MPCSTLVLNSKDTVVKDHHILFNSEGKPKAQFGKVLAHQSDILIVDGEEIRPDGQVYPKDYLSQLHGGFRLTTAAIMAKDKETGKMQLEDSETHLISDRNAACFETKQDLNTASPQYNRAGDWVGILFAVQALGSVAWAVVLPWLRSRKFSYSLSLALGAAGFIMMGFLTNQYLMFVAFLLIGCAWAAMLAWPFTLLTNSLKGGNIGAYLGLFNCTICIPQIIGAIAGGWILSIFSTPDHVAPQWVMMIVAGVSLAIGACCVSLIKDKK